METIDYQRMHAQLLDMLGAKDHEDAARIIAWHHTRELAQEKAELVYQVRQDDTCEWLEVNQAFYDNPTYSKWQHRKLYAALPAERARVPDESVASFVEKAGEIIGGKTFPSGKSLAKAREICDLAIAMLPAAPEDSSHG